MNYLEIKKNRGWRGLASAKVKDPDGKVLISQGFSFSEPVWRDMLKGFMVMQTETEYVVIEFGNTDALPKPEQQRSVLIPYFLGGIHNTYTYSKETWKKDATIEHYNRIYNFIKNKNNHTQSEFNYIGIRVLPEI